MRMSKFIFSIIFLLLLFNYAEAQAERKNQGLLVGSFGQKTGDFPESCDNLKQRLQTFKPDKDILAIRLCSADQLAVAVNLSYVSLFDKLDELETQGIIKFEENTGKPIGWLYYVPRERVIFLRNDKNCPVSKNGYAETEFWIVPPNAELPAFVESRRAIQLSSIQLTSFGQYLEQKKQEQNSDAESKELTPELFNRALQQSAEFMKENRRATVVISALFAGRTASKTLSNRVVETRQFLIKSGIGEHRILVKNISLGNGTFTNDYKKYYPNISITYEK